MSSTKKPAAPAATPKKPATNGAATLKDVIATKSALTKTAPKTTASKPAEPQANGGPKIPWPYGEERFVWHIEIENDEKLPAHVIEFIKENLSFQKPVPSKLYPGYFIMLEGIPMLKRLSSDRYNKKPENMFWIMTKDASTNDEIWKAVRITIVWGETTCVEDIKCSVSKIENDEDVNFFFGWSVIPIEGKTPKNVTIPKIVDIPANNMIAINVKTEGNSFKRRVPWTLRSRHEKLLEMNEREQEGSDEDEREEQEETEEEEKKPAPAPKKKPAAPAAKSAKAAPPAKKGKEPESQEEDEQEQEQEDDREQEDDDRVDDDSEDRNKTLREKMNMTVSNAVTSKPKATAPSPKASAPAAKKTAAPAEKPKPEPKKASTAAATNGAKKAPEKPKQPETKGKKRPAPSSEDAVEEASKRRALIWDLAKKYADVQKERKKVLVDPFEGKDEETIRGCKDKDATVALRILAAFRTYYPEPEPMVLQEEPEPEPESSQEEGF